MEFKDLLRTNNKSPGVNEKRGVLVHHTAGGTYDSNMKILSEEGTKKSVHYVLGPDGEVGKIGEHTDILWHTGDGYNVINENPKEVVNLNKYYIGIEVVSDSKGGGYTDRQKEVLPELLRYIIEEEGIPVGNIHRHKMTSTLGKFDISPEFYGPLEWEWYKKEKLEGGVNDDMRNHILGSTIDSLGVIWYLVSKEDKEEVHRMAELLRRYKMS